MGCHALLQGILLTQVSNPHLVSLALADGFFNTSTTWEALIISKQAQNRHQTVLSEFVALSLFQYLTAPLREILTQSTYNLFLTIT